MLTRHKMPLVLLTVGVSTLSMTGTAWASNGGAGGTTTTSNTCHTDTSGKCVYTASGTGQTISDTNTTHNYPPSHGGTYTPPPATPLCEDQVVNNGIDHPIYSPYGSGKITINGNTYALVQARCSWTPANAAGGFGIPFGVNSYCQPLGTYVDVAFVAKMASGSGPLAQYYGVSSWGWHYPAYGRGGSGGGGGCAARWIIPTSSTVLNQATTSYVWNYALSMTPQVSLPAPVFENWTDPTVNSTWITNSFPTWPHIHASSNSGMPNAIGINYPTLVDPQTPITTKTGTYSTSGGAINVPVKITGSNGTPYLESVSEPITFSAPYKATFDHMDVYSGTDTSNNSAFSGLSVLVAPYNPVTPYVHFGNGTTGYTCSPASLAISAAMWKAMPAAQQAAIYNGADPMMPDGYSLTTPGYDRYGDCTITYRFPSGAGPGPSGDWPVYATGVWNVVWGDATAVAASVTQTFTLPPTTPGGKPQSVTITIPGSSTTSATPPAWPTVANSAPSAPLNLNVGMLEAVPVPTGTAG